MTWGSPLAFHRIQFISASNVFSLIVTSNKLMITMSASLVNNGVMKQRVKETNIKSIALHEESINHNGSST